MARIDQVAFTHGERVVREENEGSTWASVVAVVTVAGRLGVLYLPLMLR
jgi:hypothetical protein